MRGVSGEFVTSVLPHMQSRL